MGAAIFEKLISSFSRRLRPTRIEYASPRDRWTQPQSFQPDWGERAAIAASFISPGSPVIDLGCGQMQLRDHLPPGCSYYPADMKKWTDEVYEIDLDAGLFPPGSYDCAALLGVIEYLRRPENALVWARQNCHRLVTRYVHPSPLATPEQRSKNGWVNHFSEDQFAFLLEASGWHIEAQQVWREGRKSKHVVYSCR